MKAINTIINSIMKQYIKYLCTVVMVLGVSVNTWGTTETFNFATDAWGISTSSYVYGVFSNGSGKVVSCEYVKLQEYPSGTYNGIQLKVTSKENAVLKLPTFPGAVSKIEVYTISGSADEQYVDLYVDGSLITYEELNGTSAPSTAATFNCTPAIAAGSVIELQNSGETILQISRVVVTHNGSSMPAMYKIEYVSDDEDKGLVSGPSYATVGETVEFNLYPKDGYTNDGVVYYDETYYGVYESLDPGVDEFTMPAYDITVYAFFKTSSCTTSPTVTEGSNSSVTSTTATISCSSGISSLGSAGCSISSYGFVMNTTGTPTTDDTKHQVGTTYTTTDVAFSKDLTGLTPNTTYYVRPYATNGNGTAYGTQTSFTTLQRYAITYYKNDGGAASDVEYKDHGVDYTISSNKYTRDHYTLSKWHTKADGTTGTDYAKGASYTSNAALYLYAVWQINTHSLHWYKNADDADDLTGTYTDGNAIEYGATVTAPNTPTRTGYTFVGWSETSSGSTTTPVTTMPDADKSYYAIWTAHTYSVHFDANHDDAEGSMDDQDFTYGVAQALTTCGFTNEGYFFKGWATSDDGDVVYTNGQSVSNLSSTDEDVVDLFAVWGTYEKYVFACAEISVDLEDSKKVLVTSRNGVNIMAVNKLLVTVEGAVSGHTVDISSDAGLKFYMKVDGVYKDLSSNKLTAPLDDQEVYVSYNPTTAGTGAILTPTFTIKCDAESKTFNTSGEYVKVRNLPDAVAIVANVGGSWHGLSADITSSSTPKDQMIAVATDGGGILKAYGPSANFAYKLWPVKTTTGSADRFGTGSGTSIAFADRLRFAGKDDKALMANNNDKSNKYNINNYAVVDAIDDDPAAPYEWKVTTTEVGGQFVYTLQTDQTNNTRYLRMYNGRWGTYLDGKGTEELYILPLVNTALVDMQPYEWGTNQVVVYYTPSATPVALTAVNVGSDAASSPTFVRIGTSDLWRVSGLTGLASKPAQQLQIQITENKVAKQGLLQIPLIVSDEKTEQQLRESLPGANADARNKVAKNTDVVILSGGKMTTGTASGNFQDLYIYAGGKAIVSNAMSFGSIYMRGGFGYIGDATWDVPRAKIDAAVSLAEDGALYYDLTVDANKYYDLAVPYEVDLNDATDDKGDDDFDVWLKVYDGAKRAGNTKKGWDWYNWSGDLKLHPGTGYLIAATPRYNRSYCTIRFPMNPDLSSGEAAHDAIDVTAYGITDGELDEGVTANNAGWNFIANPYMCNFGMDEIGESEDGVLKIGELSLDGDNKYQWDASGAKNIRYVTIFDYNSQEYSQVAMSSAVLDPFTGFFVQVAIDGAVEFAAAGRQLSVPAYLRAKQLPSDMEIALRASGNDETDETRLHINDELTLASALEFPDEMTKQINAGHLNFYTISNFTNMYANGMSYEDAQDWIPAGLVIPVDGTYTFSVGTVNEDYIKSVLLKDLNNGFEFDLLKSSPQFILNAGTIDTRFAVKIVLNNDETTTPIDAVGSEMSNVSPIKFLWEEKMFIMNNGVIYDATGKKVR